MKRVLVSYVRKQGARDPENLGKRFKGQPIGVVAAIGKGLVGWSLCMKTDGWDAEHARNLAIGRAVTQDMPDTAQSVKKALSEMYFRSENYYGRKRKNNSEG